MFFDNTLTYDLDDILNIGNRSDGHESFTPSQVVAMLVFARTIPGNGLDRRMPQLPFRQRLRDACGH